MGPSWNPLEGQDALKESLKPVPQPVFDILELGAHTSQEDLLHCFTSQVRKGRRTTSERMGNRVRFLFTSLFEGEGEEGADRVEAGRDVAEALYRIDGVEEGGSVYFNMFRNVARSIIMTNRDEQVTMCEQLSYLSKKVDGETKGELDAQLKRFKKTFGQQF